MSGRLRKDHCGQHGLTGYIVPIGVEQSKKSLKPGTTKFVYDVMATKI